MKKTILNVLLLAATAIGIASCGNTSNQASAQNRVTVNQSQPQDITIDDAHVPDFDVNAFAGLLTKTANAVALEQAINTPDNAINHLHQNDPTGNPPKIDYLKVDQVSNSQMVVYDETPNGKVTVATLNINTQNNSYSVAGSPTYCGSDPSMYSYQSQPGLTFGQLLFLSWMIAPHPFYHPYWGYGHGYYRGYHSYGYNPGYRNSYRTSYRTTYRTTYNTTHPNSGNRSTTRTNTPTQQRANTPQTPARTSATNPNNTQRQFRANEGNRFKSGGSNANGFRNTPTPTRSAPSHSSPSRTSSSPSRGGFGGGRSSSSGRRR